MRLSNKRTVLLGAGTLLLLTSGLSYGATRLRGRSAGLSSVASSPAMPSVEGTTVRPLPPPVLLGAATAGEDIRLVALAARRSVAAAVITITGVSEVEFNTVTGGRPSREEMRYSLHAHYAHVFVEFESGRSLRGIPLSGKHSALMLAGGQGDVVVVDSAGIPIKPVAPGDWGVAILRQPKEWPSEPFMLAAAKRARHDPMYVRWGMRHGLRISSFLSFGGQSQDRIQSILTAIGGAAP
jgi:hypothetical protein